MDATFGAAVGRHRIGRPGLVWVGSMITLARRGFFAAMFAKGRHRTAVAEPTRYPVPAPAPAPAV